MSGLLCDVLNKNIDHVCRLLAWVMMPLRRVGWLSGSALHLFGMCLVRVSGENWVSRGHPQSLEESAEIAERQLFYVSLQFAARWLRKLQIF
jgi:hypothetical protein